MTPPAIRSRRSPGEGPVSRPPWVLLAVLVPLVTGGLFAWHSLVDLDIWFHLRAGQDVLGGEGFLRANGYSFTEPARPWINHEWMFQVLAAWTGPSEVADVSDRDVFGWNLVRLILTLLLVVSLFAGDGLLRNPRWESAVWTSLAISAGLMLMWPRLTLRPELFSYIFLVCVVRLTERVFSLTPGTVAQPPPTVPGKRSALDLRNPYLGLFLVTVAWAQFHGFASIAPLLLIIGLALVFLQSRAPGFPRTDPSGMAGRASQARRGILIVLLGVVALVVTPNGVQGLIFPLRALGQFSESQVDMRRTISELVPLMQTPNSLGLTLQLFWAGLAWGVCWIAISWGRVSLLRIIVFFLAAAAAWTNQRSIGLFGLSLVLLHTGYVGNLPTTRILKSWFRIPPGLRLGFGLVLVLAFPVLLWPRLVDDTFYLREGVGRRFGSGLTPGTFPQAPARLLAERSPLRIFANIDAAAFLLANRGGQVFIDGRTEAYSPALWSEYARIRSADDQALALLDRRRIQAVCLATSGTAFTPLATSLLASSRWRLEEAGAGGLLFMPAEKTVRIDGTSTPADWDRGLLEVRARTITDGVALPADAPGDTPGDARRADLCQAAANLYGFAGNAEGQEAALRLGLSWREDHPTLRHNLGNILLAAGRTEEALRQFQRALAVNPRLAGSALNAGVCQMRLGRPAMAEREFRRAVAIDPRRFEAWANLAVVLLQDNRREEGARALEKALEIRPENEAVRRRLDQLRRDMRP